MKMMRMTRMIVMLLLLLPSNSYNSYCCCCCSSSYYQLPIQQSFTIVRGSGRVPWTGPFSGLGSRVLWSFAWFAPLKWVASKTDPAGIGSWPWNLLPIGLSHQLPGSATTMSSRFLSRLSILAPFRHLNFRPYENLLSTESLGSGPLAIGNSRGFPVRGPSLSCGTRWASGSQNAAGVGGGGFKDSWCKQLLLLSQNTLSP